MSARVTVANAVDPDRAGRVAFADYLEAKFPLDERSLNRDVRKACVERIARNRKVLRWLDVGTGTGAMVRRLLQDELPPSLAITALDHDAAIVDIASTLVTEQLERLSYRVRLQGGVIEAERRERHVRVAFQRCGLFDFQLPKAGAYDLVTAHGFMDIVPLAPALARFAAWLAPGGVLYATLNYDGDTALLPLYRDAAFEAEVLAEYDNSMERRRLQEQPTGGARSGRRLHALLTSAGFDPIAYGSSDWNITPHEGRYRDRDADILRALLAFVHAESERAPSIDREKLARWHTDRMDRLERCELGMIVHQLDIAATRRQRLTAFT